MHSPLGVRRLEIFKSLRTRGAEPLRLEKMKLRHSLGVGVGDLKVPFAIAEDAHRLLLPAARQLALLVRVRHRHLLSADDQERLALHPEAAALPAVGDGLAPVGGGPDTQKLAAAGPRVHRGLTGAVLSAWLGPGGGGRSLVAFVTDLLRRSHEEMLGTQGAEETPALVSLMLSTVLSRLPQALESQGLPSDPFVKSATAAGSYLAMQLGVERAFRETGAAQDLVMRVEAPFSPISWAGGPDPLACPGAHLYGCELAAGLPGQDALLARMPAAASLEDVAQDLAKRLKEGAEQARKAEWAVASAGLTALLRDVALLAEAGALEPELGARVRELYFDPGQLARLAADEKERKALAKELERGDAGTPEGELQLHALIDALKVLSPKEPAAALGLSTKEALLAYAEVGVAALADVWLERAVGRSVKFLELRTGREEERGLEAEHAEGRLYRLSARSEPILRKRSDPLTGALFVDVKDFTRRTALLGQAVMADFLRTAFYQPVLAAAKQHAGPGHLLGSGGVTINNLLGDAVSISGRIDALVALAVQIRQHLAELERQLKSRVPPSKVEEAIRKVEREFAEKSSSPGGASAERLAAERAVALARARGEGLEASVFVSFGPAPLVIRVEDDVFGASKVAIADRINESARGTARAGSARARADALLQAERERRKAPDLEHPWAVFVDAPLQVSIPAPLEARAQRALAAGDREGARAALLEALDQAVARLPTHQDGPEGDIYNAGAALSEEALNAYREVMGARRRFHTLEVAPEALPAELRERYFFPPQRIRLCAARHPDGRLGELFRYVGRALFKGLERSGAGVPVWEVVTDPVLQSGLLALQPVGPARP